MCASLRPMCTSAVSLWCAGSSSNRLQPTTTACICSTTVLVVQAAACKPTCCLFQFLLHIVHQAEHSRREVLCWKEACRHGESTVSAQAGAISGEHTSQAQQEMICLIALTWPGGMRPTALSAGATLAICPPHRGRHCRPRLAPPLPTHMLAGGERLHT